MVLGCWQSFWYWHPARCVVLVDCMLSFLLGWPYLESVFIFNHGSYNKALHPWFYRAAFSSPAENYNPWMLNWVLYMYPPPLDSDCGPVFFMWNGLTYCQMVCLPGRRKCTVDPLSLRKLNGNFKFTFITCGMWPVCASTIWPCFKGVDALF